FPGDPVTDVTLTGTEQIVRDTTDAPCGITSKDRKIVISAPYAPLYAAHQDTGCVVTPFSQVEARTMVTTISLTSQEFYCGILKRQLSQTYGCYNPQRSRYRWDSSSPPVSTCLSTSVDPGA